MADEIINLINAIRNSRLLRVLLISFLVLLLQIPIFMIVRLIGDRTATSKQAIEDVTGKLGKQQSIMGPVLVVPYVSRWTEEEAKSGRQETKTTVRYCSFLPEDLEVGGKI